MRIDSTKSQIQTRRQNLSTTIKRYREKRELPDGYEFSYPNTDKWQNQLEQFKQNCAIQIPIFNIEFIDDVENELVWLRIHTTEQGKKYLDRWSKNMRQSRSRKGNLAVKSLRLMPRLLTSRFRVLPDFIIIGAARCGTTSFYTWLSKHPDIVSAFKKEIYFFDRTYRRGLIWYRSFFPTHSQMRSANQDAQTKLITGEATPDYIFHPHAPKRIFEHIPQAKLIVVLRNPVDRAYSNFVLHRRRAIETLSFEQAIACEEQRLAGELERMLDDEHYYSFNRQNYSYLARGVYAEQLERWYKYFSQDQILILSSEDLNRNLATNNSELMEFLGLPDWEAAARYKQHSIPHSDMSQKTRDQLVEYFRPHNNRLYELLGRDFGWER